MIRRFLAILKLIPKESQVVSKKISLLSRVGAVVLGAVSVVGLPACSENVDGNPPRGTVSAPRNKDSEGGAKIDVKTEGQPEVR